MPVSVIQAAKRFLVNLLLTFARHYQVTLTISRESEDKDVVRAFKKMILKAHPDKGGREGDAQKLNTALEAWDSAKKTLLFQNSATKSKRLPVRSLRHLLFQLYFVREGAKINALPGRKILMDPFRA